MKFTLVHGNSVTGGVAAVPRNWLIALVIVIVAQWTLWTATNIGDIIAALVVSRSDLSAMVDFTGISDYAALAIELAAYGALATLAIVL